jgi:glycosyltransferase involved in cell wall biosynthesis
MSEPKNHATLIRAFSIVLSKDDHSHLLLVGDGLLKDNLIQLCNQLGIMKHVHFIGVQRDIHSFYSAMDIFAFPSTYESLGLAVLEAQDAGLPVAASDIPGLSEAVAPCWKKYCFPPKDQEALASNIVLAKNERKYRPSEFLEPFSEKNANARLEKAYLQIVR